MPKISNVLICDMPLRFDTYKGCSHACEYCFVKLKTDINNIEIGETNISLLNFIKKIQNKEPFEKVFDFQLPIHWGGVSDPFQPIELKKRMSYKCLLVFRETQYPFVISTKNDIITNPEYLDVLKDCNCAVQFSAVGESYDSFEKGATPFLKRIDAMKKITDIGKRVIVRAQSLIPKVGNEFISNLKLFVNAGVYGIIIEFMKYKFAAKNTIKVRGDNCYKFDVIKPIFDNIKYKANNLGLKVFAGENRLRQFGDGLNCCGVGDLWQTHELNLNHLLWDDKKFNFTKIHSEKGLNASYGLGRQDTKGNQLLKEMTYKDALNISMKDKQILSAYTIDKRAYQIIKQFKEFK